jgi:hypothetical protein
MIAQVVDPIGGVQFDVVDRPVVDMSSTAGGTAHLGFSGWSYRQRRLGIDIWHGAGAPACPSKRFRSLHPSGRAAYCAPAPEHARSTGMDRNVPEPLGALGAPNVRPDRPTGCHGSTRRSTSGAVPVEISLISAYACPMRAHARVLRATTSTCRPPRTRSSPATSRHAHPAYACVCRTDKAPRKTPEKLGSSTPVPARTRWSLRCACAKERDEPDELVAGANCEWELQTQTARL